MNNMRDPFNLNRFNRSVFEKDNVMSDSPFDDEQEQKQKGSLLGKLFGFQQRAMRDIWSFLSWDFLKNNWGKMIVMFFFTVILCLAGPGLACYGFGFLIGASTAWHWIAIVVIGFTISGWWLFVPWYMFVVIKISFPFLKFIAKLPDTKKDNSEESDED